MLAIAAVWKCQVTIDLFRLYVLLSQCRSCANTLLNCFFQITSYSRAYVPVSTHKKKQSVKFPLDRSIGKRKTYKLKRAIDRLMVIQVSESRKLLLVEFGIQEFFFVESGIAGLGI